MILVAVGANIPGADGAAPRENCERALALLEADGMAIVARSRWYRSPPWPRSNQPDYVNGVAQIETHGSPEALLRRLHAIEARKIQPLTVTPSTWKVLSPWPLSLSGPT